MDCPDDTVLADLVAGRVTDSVRAELVEHLEGCPECRSLVAALAEGWSSAPKAERTHLEGQGARRTHDDGILRRDVMVDHFRVLRHLASGGMGEVYVAQDTRLGRKVALKVIRPGAMSADAIARFQREARALARVNHPNIVMIYQIGEWGGAPYVAMEYVEGTSLGEQLRAGRVSVQPGITILIGVAEAVAAAHRRGIVHRDLKPDNVIIAADGRVRVLDFGLAAMSQVDDADSFAATFVALDGPELTTDTGQAGTPMFMAPEQWAMAPTSGATDVWAFGVMFYHLLTGAYPFHATDAAELARKVREEEPVPPSVHGTPATGASAMLERLVLDCFRKDPGDRPDIDTLLARLRSAADGIALEDAPTQRSARDAAVGPTPTLVSGQDRAPVVTIAAPPRRRGWLLVAVALVAAIAWGVWSRSERQGPGSAADGRAAASPTPSVSPSSADPSAAAPTIAAEAPLPAAPTAISSEAPVEVAPIETAPLATAPRPVSPPAPPKTRPTFEPNPY